ncbi:MAG TPA: T9SS type A sorting domain-containing protein, partial [Patescibacteria group bacterium]|nr:T9SS type A sorting domain-containing protein [Patescibacteria group bacterium]
TENITITFPKNHLFKNTTIILRDIAGRQLYLKEADAFKNSYSFSLHELPVGVYVVEVHSGSDVFVQKVSVVR